MNKHQGRAIRAALGDILLRHWDPIGIQHIPEAQDEYDGYVGGVYQLLAEGATDLQIAQHLRDVETRRLGFEDSDARMLIPLAQKLQRAFARLSA